MGTYTLMRSLKIVATGLMILYPVQKHAMQEGKDSLILAM
jgi:hypothetical protein